MRRLLLCCICIMLLSLLGGCAVAVTAHVDMPDNFAQGSSVRPVAVQLRETPMEITDIIVPEEPLQSAPISAKNEAAVPLENAEPQAEAQIEPFVAEPEAPLGAADAAASGEAQIEPIQSIPVQTPALAEEPAATEVPDATQTPAPTEAPEPEATPSFSVKKLDPEKGYVAAKTVNLRSGPDTSYDILGEYERGDTLMISGKSGDWYFVEIDGKLGFMSREYVEDGVQPTPTPEPTPTPTPKPTKTPKIEPTPEPLPDIVPEPIPTQAPLVPPVPPAPSAPAVNTSPLSDELYLVAQLVNEETGPDGYLAVAQVIYNRVKSSKFPNTISGVVFQSGQFTPAEHEAELRAVVPSSGAISAVQQVFVQGVQAFPENVLYFRAARSGTSWGKRSYYATVGGNAFFY